MRNLISKSSLAFCALALAGCANVSHQESPKVISVSGAPKAVGPYSQAIDADGIVYTAGMLPRDATAGNLVQGDMTAQANQIFDNLDAILKGAGGSLKNVIKVTVYMTDLADFGKFNDAMSARFGDNKPARTTVQVAKLPAGAQIEVDMVAKIPHQ